MSEKEHSAESAACTQPLCSGGAVAFFQQHGESNFLEACYQSAPPRIQAALAAELDYLRGALPAPSAVEGRGAGRVLELGCGDGRLLEALAEDSRAWVGVDLMESYLRYARAHRRLAPGTGLAAGLASRLPFADASFDAVVCAQNTFGLLGEAKLPTLREAVRVTRPGGRLLLVVYSEFSVVPRIEWYTEENRRGMMAPLDWSRSHAELLVTTDGHASECFRRERLEELFAAAGLAPRLERLGEIYWAVTVLLSC